MNPEPSPEGSYIGLAPCYSSHCESASTCARLRRSNRQLVIGRPTASAGDLLRGPVGSTGVRTAIERFKPVLGVHGHIHESGGERRIGDTLCVNAGSEASMGILRGYLVDLSERGVERTLRVEG